MSAFESVAEAAFRVGGIVFVAGLLLVMFCMVRHMQRLAMPYRTLKTAAALFVGGWFLQGVAVTFLPNDANLSPRTELIGQQTYNLLICAIIFYAVFKAIKMFERPEQTQGAWKIVARLSRKINEAAEGRVIVEWPDVIGDEGDQGGAGAHAGKL